VRTGQIRDCPDQGVEECSRCGLVTHQTDLRNSINYEAGSMHNWASGYGGTLNSPREDLARRVEAIKFLSLKRKLKTILDFGSGEGEMIDVLATEFNVRGLEPEDDARARCLKKGRQVFASTDEALSAKNSYDAVTLFHVIEHFYDPFSELKKIQDLLNPGGVLDYRNSKFTRCLTC